MANDWHAPGWSDGILIDKPENFDAMVAAAAEETRTLIANGLERGDNQVKTAAWLAADVTRRAASESHV